jgi:hypothetical protein
MSLEGLKISTTGHSSMVYWDMILLSMVEIISTKLHGVIEEGNINAYCCENLKFRRNRLIRTSLGLEEGNPNCCVSFKTPFDRTLTSDNDFPPQSHGSTALVSLGLLYEVPRSHSDTPHSVGLLWTGDQPVEETSTWQHTTLTRDRHPCPPSGIRTRNPSKRAAVEPRLRQRGHWDRLPPHGAQLTFPGQFIFAWTSQLT